MKSIAFVFTILIGLLLLPLAGLANDAVSSDVRPFYLIDDHTEESNREADFQDHVAEGIEWADDFYVKDSIDAQVTIGAFLNNKFSSASPGTGGTWSQRNYFPSITFSEPVRIIEHPVQDKLLVVSKNGLGHLISNAEGATDKTLYFDIGAIMQGVPGYGEGGVSDFAFHPEFGTNTANSSFVYLTYWHSPDHNGTISDSQKNGYHRLSRFSIVDSKLDLDSEAVLISQYDRDTAHASQNIEFGPDGFLYLSLGDETWGCCGINDTKASTQKLDGGLWSGVLRIDVDKNPYKSHPIRRQPTHPVASPQENGSHWPESFTQGYYIPNDNPFLDPNGSVLEEFYAYGFRNPWTMAFDELTGEIWLADVGDDRKEEINLIVKGGNYQWPFKEGDIAGPNPDHKLSTGTEIGPVWSYGPEVGQAPIGAGVYRGSRYPELYGKYLFSDWVSGGFWSIGESNGKFSVTQLGTVSAGLTDGINSHLLDRSGRILMAKSAGPQNANGSVQIFDRIVSNSNAPPALLSAVGAFTDLSSMMPVPGCIAYELNVPFWSDGAVKSRWICVPSDGIRDTPSEKINYSEEGIWQFPVGTVFIKHFEMAVDTAYPADTFPLETRFLVHGDEGYYGVTYRWNPAGTDATLESGQSSSYDFRQNTGTIERTWKYLSRTECMVCHNRVAGSVLGLNTRQLNRDHTNRISGKTANQLETYNTLGLLSPAIDPALVIPNSLTATPTNNAAARIEDRARSYLDSNCSYCHQPGGVRANFDARLTTPLAKQGLINGELYGNYEIANSKLVVPRSPAASMIYHRTNQIGDLAMPPLSKALIDYPGLAVIEQWIRSIDPIITPQTFSITSRVANRSDDAEERANGDMYIDSSDIELTSDSGVQTVGLRFSDLAVPAGAVIENAYLQFQVDEVSSGTTQLNIFAEASSNAVSFADRDNDISSRSRTATSVEWRPASWSTIGQRGADQRSPDLSSIVQSIVNRSNWNSGQAIAFIITGSGARTAESYEGDHTAAASLTIEYSIDGNLAPSAKIQALPASGNVPLTVAFQSIGTNDDGTIIQYDWDFGNGDTLIDAGSASSYTFTEAGNYTARVMVTDDGGKRGYSSIQIDVTDPKRPLSVSATIASGSDDAEESASGAMYLDSSDIELIEDSGVQTVGLRFTNLLVPAGSVIENAYIQFQVDEVNTGAAQLTIVAQASSNAAPFDNRDSNLSSRSRSASSVEWSPAPWSTIGQRSAAQRTPDLSVIVQSIVNRSTWDSGQPIAFIITGSGEHTAESYEGSPAAAASLHLEYSTDGNLPPQAQIQAVPERGHYPLTVTFTTTGSSDDGSIERYDWDFGNADSQNNSGDSISYTYRDVGIYHASVTISDDKGKRSIARVTINVADPSPSPPIESAQFVVKSGDDDAEERMDFSVYLNSSDLELSEDRGPQTIGLRFAGVAIPRGAVIESASIQFTTDESSSGNSNLEIAVESSDNATAYKDNAGDVSNRSTGEAIAWSPPAWNSIGIRSAAQRTPELRHLVQQIVDRRNWASGNAIAFVITGSGVRTAESYEGDANSAATLNVEYSFDGNQAPIARILAEPDAGDYPLAVLFDGSASSDDGRIESYDWVFGDGRFQLEGPVNPSVTYANPGTYTAVVTVTDGAGKSSDASIEIIVTDPQAPVQPETAVYSIASGADDVEQRADFSMYIDSSDLELTEDGGVQIVGLRFTNITLPRSALIHDATIQFTADETHAQQTSTSIAAQVSGNAPKFTNAAGNLSSRAVGNVVEWAPLPWSMAGERAAAQRTPSLTDSVQEIVNRTDWTSGNAIAFIISGSGKRAAESYEGDRNNAAALTIEYSISQ